MAHNAIQEASQHLATAQQEARRGKNPFGSLWLVRTTLETRRLQLTALPRDEQDEYRRMCQEHGVGYH